MFTAESTVRRIFAELCKAVSWMHSVGLVHRDIKLENVLLTVSLSEAALFENGHRRTVSDEYSRSRQSDDESLGFLDKATSSSPTSYAFADSSTYGSSPGSPTGSSFSSHYKLSRYPSESSTSMSSASAASSWYLSSDTDSKASMPMETSLLGSRSHTLVPSDMDHKPSSQIIPPPSQPLIKLTDFGLSRFIDPAKPLLMTRCGSEAYAAPELVMSGGRAGVASGGSRWGEDGGYSSEAGRRRDSTSSGGYDARETDAWACGVVLYGLIARRLPFGEGPGEALISGVPGGVTARPVGTSERRQWLMKIARGDWQWPSVNASSEGSSSGDEELRGVHLAESEGAKRVASKLLIRDPTRRYRLKDLWDDEWVAGCGVVGATSSSPLRGASVSPQSRVRDLPMELDRDFVKVHDDSGVEITRHAACPDNVDEQEIPIRHDVEHEPDEEDDDEEDGAEDGWLVDKEGIKSIARQEVQ
ncbi:hypothetical protein D9758_001470 [Tetrapyrgos nigripes]|uniref:non-specific serine/threonine protein kinase n=1 Tax=Tetrapyrgos nigripes TaxID=182062 RepID=A0A8H5GXW0_9AGAR|nr:hypothetical protein D9758_001470 [Tetrapyrgos nigripes]